jgi:hypothetical protein
VSHTPGRLSLGLWIAKDTHRSTSRHAARSCRCPSSVVVFTGTPSFIVQMLHQLSTYPPLARFIYNLGATSQGINAADILT